MLSFLQENPGKIPAKTVILAGTGTKTSNPGRALPGPLNYYREYENLNGTRVLFNGGHCGTAKFAIYHKKLRNLPFSAKYPDFDFIPR